METTKLKIDEKKDNSFISTSHTHATATSRSRHRHTKNMRQLRSAAGGAVVQNKQKSFLSMTDTAFNIFSHFSIFSYLARTVRSATGRESGVQVPVAAISFFLTKWYKSIYILDPEVEPIPNIKFVFRYDHSGSFPPKSCVRGQL